MIKNIYCDIETGPLPEAELSAVMPEFEPAANLKDPEKIKANIEAKKAKWMADAALSPLTGEVLCIGYIIEDGFIMDERPEPELLGHFWDLVQENLFDDPSLIVHFIGWCCHKFDLPFLIKRSVRYGIPIPFGVRLQGAGRGQHSYWNEKLVDLMVQWQLGDREAESSLDSVARFLGVGQKSGKGADFAFLWKNDKVAARKYLENDCRLLQGIHQKMGNL